MANRQMNDAERRAHKKLIAPNIVIVLLSLAAALTLVFGSWLDIRVPVNKDLAAAVVDSMGSSANIDEDQLNFIVKDVDSEIGVSVSPLQLLRAGTDAGREGLKQVLTEVLAEATSTVDEIVAQALPAALSVTIVETVLDELPADFTYEDIEIPQEMDQTTQKLAQESDPAVVKSELKDDFLSAADAFVAQNSDLLGISELTEEHRAQLADVFDEAVDLMTVDGEFSLSNLGNAIDVLMNRYGGSLESSGMQALALTYAAARAASSDDVLLTLVQDPGAFVDDMSETALQLTKMICLLLAVFMLLIALLWAVLAIFAFVHIFTPNKKVGMWYVKATGYLPCLLFVIVPAIAMALLPMMIPSFPAIGVTFGGMTIVSGACYVALWLVSAIWCHLVRKQIARAAYAADVTAAAAAAADAAAAPALAKADEEMRAQAPAGEAAPAEAPAEEAAAESYEAPAESAGEPAAPAADEENN